MNSNEIINSYWSSIGCLPSCANGKVHVAVFDARTANLILQGKKQIETRFSISKQVPFGKIREGDTILIKKSGGPVVGIAQADRVCFYSNLDVEKVDLLKVTYNDMIQAGNEFWSQKRTARYATFVYLDKIRLTEPFRLPKKDRCGWRVYDSTSELELVKS